MRKIPLLYPFDRTAHHDFTMGSEVIDLTIFESFYFVFFISAWIWLSIDYRYSRSIGEVSVRMRYVIALEDDISLFWNIITESFEDIFHVFTSEGTILETGHLSFVGILSSLSERKGDEIILRSYLRIFDRDMFLSEKLDK